MPTLTFRPEAGQLVGSETLPEAYFDSGSNVTVEAMAFDDTANEAIQFRFSATDYTSGNITVTIRWGADTATTGDVVWGASLAVITPNSDSQAPGTNSWATENTATDSHIGTTASRVHEVDITVSNLDSLAADDIVWLRIRRLPTNGSDTMAGDALLYQIIASYT